MTPFILKINYEIFYYKVFIEHKWCLLHYNTSKKIFNNSSEKIIFDVLDQSMYTNFWTEYEDVQNKYK